MVSISMYLRTHHLVKLVTMVVTCQSLSSHLPDLAYPLPTYLLTPVCLLPALTLLHLLDIHQERSTRWVHHCYW